jgi:hypothetical protein
VPRASTISQGRSTAERWLESGDGV